MTGLFTWWFKLFNFLIEYIDHEEMKVSIAAFVLVMVYTLCSVVLPLALWASLMVLYWPAGLGFLFLFIFIGTVEAITIVRSAK